MSVQDDIADRILHALDPWVTGRRGYNDLTLNVERVAGIAAQVVLNYRREHMAEGNNRAYGVGNWIECYACPPDAAGFPIFHHKDAHPNPSGRFGPPLTRLTHDPRPSPSSPPTR